MEVKSSQDFTIGVCATGESPEVAELVSSLLGECRGTLSALQKLIVVASDCPPETVAALKQLQTRDKRIELLVELARNGKADAINKILDRSKTPLLLFANSDSRPEPGALPELFSLMKSEERVGAVSAIPVPEQGRGLISHLLGFMWTAHNNCSVALNHMNVSNHSCDELALFRAKAISFLPQDTVNDGAFLAATARLRGFSIKVSTAAKVKIRTPRRIADVILQRRRILFGHAQIWRQVGIPPKTIESLLFLSPAIGLRLLVSTFAARPRYLLVTPVALISEIAAALLSIFDTMRSSRAHAVWRRFR